MLNKSKRATTLFATVAIGIGFLLHTQTNADEGQVITDISSWNHPVKKVLQDNKVKITKLKLLKNNKYPVFYVELPYDPQSSETSSYFYNLYAEILEANGWWSYALYSTRDQVKIEIDWDKTKKAMSVNIVPVN